MVLLNCLKQFYNPLNHIEYILVPIVVQTLIDHTNQSIALLSELMNK